MKCAMHPGVLVQPSPTPPACIGRERVPAVPKRPISSVVGRYAMPLAARFIV